MDRTIVLQMHPAPEQVQVLQRTLEQYTDCYNAVAQEGFTTECSNGVELHKRTYYALRAQYPDLPISGRSTLLLLLRTVHLS